MKVEMLEPPPESTDGLAAEHPIRALYHNHFAPFFNALEKHYTSRFSWLTDELRGSERVAVIGSGKGGAEAFALMWHLGARTTVGFDKKLSWIQQSMRNRKAATDLVDIWVPQVFEHTDATYQRQFQDWYVKAVTAEVRGRVLPDFLASDIQVALACKAQSFNTCYSRYLLDKVREHLRPQAVEEMVRITICGGYVAIVAPERAFSFSPSSLDMTLVKAVGPEQLGDLEWKDNPPVGRLYRKSGAGAGAS